MPSVEGSVTMIWGDFGHEDKKWRQNLLQKNEIIKKKSILKRLTQINTYTIRIARNKYIFQRVHRESSKTILCK